MIYHFGTFSLDTQNFQLSSNGDEIPLEPQVFDLLGYLLVNRDRLVTREELFNSIWKGRVVSDTSLSNHVKSARKAIVFLVPCTCIPGIMTSLAIILRKPGG
jgi:DNA-binding winged helix-turn-helix (wHTH) protein